MKKAQQQKTEELLEDIKKLFILLLYKNGVAVREIGPMIGISYKTIENMIPGKSKGGRGRKKKK